MVYENLLPIFIFYSFGDTLISTICIHPKMMNEKKSETIFFKEVFSDIFWS